MTQVTSEYINIVTLMDGSQVTYATWLNTAFVLDHFEGFNHHALYYLYYRCCGKQDYRVTDATKKSLKNYSFINDNDEVNPDIKKIVLNSVTASGTVLTLDTSYKRINVSKVRKEDWLK